MDEVEIATVLEDKIVLDLAGDKGWVEGWGWLAGRRGLGLWTLLRFGACFRIY